MNTIPKFSNISNSFHTELKKRVQEYFDKSGKLTTGNTSLFAKGIMLVSSFLFLYIHLVFFTPGIFWAITECLLLGGVTAAIGFNIMHDGAHGSFSKYKFINKAAAFTLNGLGGSHFMWNMKHNIIHHAYTNIDGVDDDINIQPWMRMSSTQKRYKMHRFQHYYFWVLYSSLYIFWIFLLDYTKYFRKRIGSTPLKKMQIKDHVTFWGSKVLHAFFFVALPIYATNFIAWLAGFLVYSFFAGFVLSIVFQLAHAVEHTHFPMPNEETNKMEDAWAIHQLKTTANFATHNKVVSWLVGGLNFQIEHHLFPKISHVHYPNISKIIKQVCTEFNVQYIEFKRVRTALWSHILFLKQMGNAASA
jgi:linoleoyl-CoA desaturase